jgi:hypothetical protein
LYQGEQGDQEKDKVDKREHIKVQAKVLTQWPEDAKWVEKGGTLDGYANRNIRSSSHFDYKKGVDIFQRDRIFFKGTGYFSKEQENFVRNRCLNNMSDYSKEFFHTPFLIPSDESFHHSYQERSPSRPRSVCPPGR